MSSIVQRKIGKQIYLYESISYRNAEGKPRNKRQLIGKIDSATGEPLYKTEYMERMLLSGTPMPEITKSTFTIEAIKNSTIKEVGAFYLLKSIANRIGVYEILRESFPYRWEQLFNVASYIVLNGDPLMYCEEWHLRTESLQCGSLSSQRIAELLQSINNEERRTFYEKWGKYRSEQEYLALDITSISSYSELIADVEWGYNRDHETLPQINLCMLMGEKSRLPVFQTTYSGSLKDVSTLKTTLQLASNLPLKNTVIVMDKGFCSSKNITTMLSDSQGIKFLIAMSFTLSFTKKQIISEQKDIDRLENTIVVGEDVIRGVTKKRSWNTSHSVFTHIYYNAAHAIQAKDRLYGRISKLVEYAKLEPDAKRYAKDFEKYLIIRKSEKADIGHTVNIRINVVEDELAHCGWLVLVSNHVDNVKDAISIYRAKDVVEKGFLRMKNCLDLGRLRVHSDNAMQNKIFVGFISLILMSGIHNIMADKDLYKNMTMKSLFLTLEKLRVQFINGERILFPITKEQKAIFDAFGVQYPV